MDGLPHDILTATISAVSSVAVTLAVFRSRLDVMDAKREALESKVADDRKADRELWQEKLDRVVSDVGRIAEEGRKRFDTSERLQRAVLNIVSGIAGKEGTDNRTPADVLTRLISHEE